MIVIPYTLHVHSREKISVRRHYLRRWSYLRFWTHPCMKAEIILI